MKLEELKEFTALPEYNRVPLELATLEAAPDARWWQIHELLVKHEQHLAIWEAGQYMVMLMEAYPGLVQSVQLDISIDDRVSGTVIDHRLLINDVFCDPDYNEFEDEQGSGFLHAIQGVDSSASFSAAVYALNDVASTHLKDNSSNLLDAFNNEQFTSIAQIQARLVQQAGLVRAKLDAMRLSGVVQDVGHLSRARPRQKPGM